MSVSPFGRNRSHAGSPTVSPPFLDTNTLLYAVKKDGDPRAAIAAELLAKGGFISVQVLNEFANASRNKLKKSWFEIDEAISFILDVCEPPLPLTLQTHKAGLRLSTRYGFSIYDSLILASTLEAGCKVLYTEDMQNNQVVEGIVIRNPFK